MCYVLGTFNARSITSQAFTKSKYKHYAQEVPISLSNPTERMYLELQAKSIRISYQLLLKIMYLEL